MTRRVNEKQDGVERPREPLDVMVERPAETAAEREGKRRTRILAGVVATLIVAAVCCLVWGHVELRQRHALLEEEAGRRNGELASVAEAAHALCKRIEAQLLAHGGWPPEPTAYVGGASAEPVHAITRELFEIERLMPRLDGERQAMAGTTPAALGVPLDGAYWISSGMGWRKDPRIGALRFHPGLDLAAPPGTPVVAAAAGSVAWAGRYPREKSRAWWNHGNLVVLRHGDTMTLYAHLDKVRVLRGTWVARGEALGSVGTTGVTTGPHLHYEVRQLGDAGVYIPVDPREAALR